MLSLKEDNLFFFYDDCSSIKILPNSLEHAYLALLNDDLLLSQNIFSHIDSPRAKWGLALVNILAGYLKFYPSYFQLRNFFEIDLDFLLRNKKVEYIEMLLGSLDLLFSINQEIYKYSGRVLLLHKFYSASIKYFEKAKKLYYNDPELHFLLSRYFIKTNNLSNALDAINECLRLLPEYYPAIMLKKQIEERIF